MTKNALRGTKMQAWFNRLPKTKGITDNPDYIPVDDDGVWKVSVTTMNLLYAMYLWADEHGIDNEDDWENHLELHNLQGAKK